MPTKRSSATSSRASKSASGARIWGQLKLNDLVLVDSAPLIYLLDGYPQFSSLFEGLFVAFEREQLRIAISTITIAEVLAGPFKNSQDVLAKRYEKALTCFEVIPVSQEIAVSASRLRIACKLKLMDALQAATALEIGAQALVTHDRDFSRFSGLPVLFGEE